MVETALGKLLLEEAPLKASVPASQERKRRAIRAAWRDNHERMSALHTALAAEHEAALVSLLEEGEEEEVPASTRRKAEQRPIRWVLRLYGLGLSLEKIGRRTHMKPSTVSTRSPRGTRSPRE